MSESHGLLIACGEPAVREALEDFEHETFEDELFERILLPGGCWWIAQAARASSGRFKRVIADRSSIVGAVTEHLRVPGLERVLLVAHQDCEWYLRRYPAATAGELVKRAGSDLFSGRDEILRLAGRPLTVSGRIFVHSAGKWDLRTLF